jgi:hypothetical protein
MGCAGIIYGRMNSSLRPWSIAAIAVLVILTVLRPGDGPFVNDESILMEYALRYNHTAGNLYGFHLPFTPCPYGLVGTVGARYGPLPAWTDQLFLLFTRDPITMLAIRAFVCAAVSAIALLWLCRTLGWTPWLAVLTMCSPWLWIYARQLWDNDLGVPLCAMTLAPYADFLLTRRAWAAALAILCGFMMVLIHFMSLALIVPLALHLLIFGRRHIKKLDAAAIAIISLTLLLAIISWPYWYYLWNYTQLGHVSPRPGWIGWVYPLYGGQELTLGMGKIMPGDGWQDGASRLLIVFITIARFITLFIALPAVWIGMILGLPHARRGLSSNLAQPVDHLCLIGWAVFVAQIFLDGLSRISFAPDYFNATWIVYIFFAWIAIQRLQIFSRRFATGLFSFQAALLVICTFIIAVTIACNGGTQSDEYGLTLSNQLAAVRQIAQCGPKTPLEVNVPQWQRHPLALRVLQELTPSSANPAPANSLIAQPQSAWPGDAHIGVRRLFVVRPPPQPSPGVPGEGKRGSAGPG